MLQSQYHLIKTKTKAIYDSLHCNGTRIMLIKPFLVNVPFRTPWKQQKTKGFPVFFSRLENGNIVQKWINTIYSNISMYFTVSHYAAVWILWTVFCSMNIIFQYKYWHAVFCSMNIIFQYKYWHEIV